MKVWDVFPFWRERWAVDARLRLWADVDVTYLPVACVGDRTHRGDSLAPPELPDGVERVSVVLDADTDWGRETQQRDAVLTLVPRMEPDDLLLLCDADELVDPAALPAIVNATEHGPVKLRMAMYACGTRWKHRDWWRHPAACRARDIPERPSEMLRSNFALPKVDKAGWHLTYLLADEVDAKLKAFAHAEADTAEMRRELAHLRATGDGWVDGPLDGPLAALLAEVLA